MPDEIAETPYVEVTEESTSRADFARDILDRLLKAKLGLRNSWCRTRVELVIKEGQLELVNVVDDVTYK